MSPPQVDPGQFAIRGGILDVYPGGGAADQAEFFGDEVESLREFDLDTQTSLRNLNDVELLLGAVDDQATGWNYIERASYGRNQGA
jgi:transcription-repair coupling factor (superfamily II helicase)